jgi:hypothetical protein
MDNMIPAKIPVTHGISRGDVREWLLCGVGVTTDIIL